jgi:hypothetical protein
MSCIYGTYAFVCCIHTFLHNIVIRMGEKYKRGISIVFGTVPFNRNVVILLHKHFSS